MKTHTKLLRFIPKASDCKTFEEADFAVNCIAALILTVRGSASKRSVKSRWRTLVKRRRYLKKHSLINRP